MSLNHLDLDAPILTVGDFTLSTRTACEGTMILGGVGSGKTSGSGRALAEAFLRAGFGGLVLTAKPGESRRWRAYGEATGRCQDITCLTPNAPSGRFNVLRYESSQNGRGGGFAANVAALLLEVVGDRGHASTDQFWEYALRQLLLNTIDLLLLAQSEVSLAAIQRVVLSAPAAGGGDFAAYDASECLQLLVRAEARTDRTSAEERTLALVRSYFTEDLPHLAEKTRSVVVTSVTARLAELLRPPLDALLGADEPDTFAPERTFEGAVHVLDLPVADFREVGRMAQRIYLTVWERAVLRRDAPTRPVFLFIDEAHHFLTESDLEFFTTCREALCATVLLTQTTTNLEAFLHARDRKAASLAVLASMRTKIFHSNGDTATNAWAEQLFGLHRPEVRRWSEAGTAGSDATKSRLGSAPPAGRSWAGGPESLPRVPAVEFTRLRKGPDVGIEALVHTGAADVVRVTFPWPGKGGP